MALMAGGRPRAQARWGRVACSEERGCETERTPFFSNRASACVCCVFHNAFLLYMFSGSIILHSTFFPLLNCSLYRSVTKAYHP